MIYHFLCLYNVNDDVNFFFFPFLFFFSSFFRIRMKNEHMERDLVLLRDRVLNAKYNCLFLALALGVLPRGINNDSYKRNTVKPASRIYS